eukprot:SAG22_NODE_8_length_37215_cov_120.960351_15_plen_172_part_00
MDRLPDEVMHRLLLLVGLKHFRAVAGVASRYRLAVGTVLDSEGERLLEEGLEWFRGDRFRVVNLVRGQALVRAAAAAGGLPLAVATCRWRAWGGYSGDAVGRRAAFRCFRQVAADGGGGGEGIVAEAEHMVGICYVAAAGWEKISWGGEVVPEGGRAGAQCRAAQLRQLLL